MRIYVLRLRQPIIVGTRAALSGLNDRVATNVSRAPVVFYGKALEAIAELIGKTVTMRGSLSRQATGRCFYPMLAVSSWEPVRDGGESVSFCGDRRNNHTAGGGE